MGPLVLVEYTSMCASTAYPLHASADINTAPTNDVVARNAMDPPTFVNTYGINGDW